MKATVQSSYVLVKLAVTIVIVVGLILRPISRRIAAISTIGGVGMSDMKKCQRRACITKCTYYWIMLLNVRVF